MHGVTFGRASEPDGSLSTVSAEFAYARVASAEHRRRFGQFFTPPSLAALMADWVMAVEPQAVLDPAFGTGMLIAACTAKNSSTFFTAYEADPLVMSHARQFDCRLDLRQADFLATPITEKYDGIVMNPPYIRHREIRGYESERRDISGKARCVIPKSANLYIYFAVKSLTLLRSGGRAALLIPAEWMSANFAASFKVYLINERLLRQAVLFSNCSNVFDDALTTASVLLCER